MEPLIPRPPVTKMATLNELKVTFLCNDASDLNKTHRPMFMGSAITIHLSLLKGNVLDRLNGGGKMEALMPPL